MPLEKAFPIPMIAATTTSENTLRCANSASAANPLAINERLNTAVGRLPTLSIIHPAAGESSKSIAFPAEVTIPTWMASSPRLCAANGMASPRALRNTCSAKHAIPSCCGEVPSSLGHHVPCLSKLVRQFRNHARNWSSPRYFT
eukprot:CAMPEP_0114240874 /NCGR_PEP_ID=MMETSP0058-20121206/9336_1 /TAXON_ID=36894 /ORGANISM="Pyramimonas parkeae, CCMP726" /LENGTH=143 /DNA_ID=CAMNT_0001353371 /DNA_START=271 /DNA_END=698 /DNA_ORIENTATION=+